MSAKYVSDWGVFDSPQAAYKARADALQRECDVLQTKNDRQAETVGRVYAQWKREREARKQAQGECDALRAEVERLREGWTLSDEMFDHFLDDIAGTTSVWDNDLTLETALAYVQNLVARAEQAEAVRDQLVDALGEVAKLHSEHHTEEIYVVNPETDEDDGENMEQIEVCSECGTHSHPEFDVWYRSWPCPTLKAARAVLAQVEL